MTVPLAALGGCAARAAPGGLLSASSCERGGLAARPQAGRNVHGSSPHFTGPALQKNGGNWRTSSAKTFGNSGNHALPAWRPGLAHLGRGRRARQRRSDGGFERVLRARIAVDVGAWAVRGS